MKKKKFVCSNCKRVYLKSMKKAPTKNDCFCHDCKDYTLIEVKEDDNQGIPEKAS